MLPVLYPHSNFITIFKRIHGKDKKFQIKKYVEMK